MISAFLKGKAIFLQPLSPEHNLDEYLSWINDQETTLYMGSGRFPQTRDSLKIYIDSFKNSKNGMLLGIFLNKGSKHIGNITLQQIDWLNRFAEIGIFIGNKKFRGKGYSKEAITLVVEHAFRKMNLMKIYAGMIEGNEISRKAFESIGFKIEGVFRSHFYLDGRYLDCYRLGLLKKEYIEE